MYNKFLFAFLALTCTRAMGQTPEDVLRLSGQTPKGSARSMAIGGAMGSLGGDIQSNFVNPAGLGFYKTNEFVISPGLQFQQNKSMFRGDNLSADQRNGTFGTSGFVFGYNDRFSNWESKAFSIAINRTADFNNRISYRGMNDFSSFTEQFAEEFANSGLDINSDLVNAPLSLGTKMAIYNYLIDVQPIDGIDEVIGVPMYQALLNNSGVLFNQQKDILTSGGITELALSFAGNKNDNFYIGGSIGIPIMNYNRTSVFRETDASGDNDNDFNFAEYTEELKSRGVGFNGKFGVIFKPASEWRIGAALHTPTIFGIKEDVNVRVERDFENYFKPIDNLPNYSSSDASIIYGNSGVPQIRYDVVSPWKFLVSGSYMISAVEDTRLQRGFITADAEYVTYSSPRFSDASSYYITDNAFYSELNGIVKDYYKGALNFRVGGEMKFHTIMARAGFAYYGNPYQDENLKNNRMLLSGGVGYRDRGFFLDLSYVHNVSNDVNFPYRLGDKANTFADLKGKTGTLALSFGVKF